MWGRGPRLTIVVSRDDLCLSTPSSLSVRHLPSQERDQWFESANSCGFWRKVRDTLGVARRSDARGSGKVVGLTVN